MITNSTHSKSRGFFTSLGRYFLWTILTLFTLGPIYWMFVVSSRSPVQVYDKPNLVITSFYAENYTKVLVIELFVTTCLIH